MSKKKLKGIVDFASSYQLFGFSAFSIGILIQSFRENRITELFLSAIYFFCFWINPTKNPSFKTSIADREATFYKFRISEGEVVCARDQGTVISESLLIACEYGDPGARIVVKSKEETKVFSPYANDGGIWHLHSIVQISPTEFLISTGDSVKALDKFVITSDKCVKKERLLKRMAGFTAMRLIQGNVWVGSDFSERVNYIGSYDPRSNQLKKYFLPKKCVRDFVVDVKELSDEYIIVLTTRLNTDRGHELLFSMIKNEYVQMREIRWRRNDAFVCH